MTTLYALRLRYAKWTIIQSQRVYTAEYRRGNAIRFIVAHSPEALSDALRKANDNPLARIGAS